MHSGNQSQKGVMLIEALVGILIFSIGILAVMGLQAVSIKNTIDAQYRTEASFLANEIIGSMWIECGQTCTALSGYNTASGSNTTMTAWRTKVAARLPGITVGGTNSPTIVVAGNTVTVTVFWQIPGSTTVRQFSIIANVNSA
jgi:type IV pilus assembly protein PilV